MSDLNIELTTDGPIPILTLAQIMGLDFELPPRSNLSEDNYQSLIANYITDLWEQIYIHLVPVTEGRKSGSDSENSDSESELTSLLSSNSKKGGS